MIILCLCYDPANMIVLCLAMTWLTCRYDLANMIEFMSSVLHESVLFYLLRTSFIESRNLIGLLEVN